MVLAPVLISFFSLFTLLGGVFVVCILLLLIGEGLFHRPVTAAPLRMLAR